LRISRELDRPGLIGFVTFILPIILDGIFHSILHQVFEKNIIALLQRDGVTFQGVAQRKREDRLLQVATLGTAALAASALTSGGLRAVAPALAGESADLGATLLLGAFLVLQVSKVWEPGMAPADVLAKTMQPVTDGILVENRGTTTVEKDDGGDGKLATAMGHRQSRRRSLVRVTYPCSCEIPSLV